MIWIHKGKEPSSLTLYRCQPNSYYDGYSQKDELREALLRDQGHLCAYCMRRIRNDRNTMKIEHWKAQSTLETEAEKLNYQIMLGVCDGCRGSKDLYTTCDEHRHDMDLHVNPLDRSMMDTIFYDRNGKIKSDVEQYDDELNTVLNLNCEQASSRIVQNRKKVYQECMKRLKRLQNDGKWKKKHAVKNIAAVRTTGRWEKAGICRCSDLPDSKVPKKMSAIIWNNGVSLSGNTT